MTYSYQSAIIGSRTEIPTKSMTILSTSKVANHRSTKLTDGRTWCNNLFPRQCRHEPPRMAAPLWVPYGRLWGSESCLLVSESRDAKQSQIPSFFAKQTERFRPLDYQYIIYIYMYIHITYIRIYIYIYIIYIYI